MIELKNVSFNYDKSSTLTDISFHIKKGEFVAVIGSNGAGKTTLSKLLNGLLKPTAGSVAISGMDTRKTKSSTLAKHIGFLFQNPDRQICKNTVGEEIRFSLELALMDASHIQHRLEEVLVQFGFNAETNPFQLSRGERQRLALASIIASEPEILVLDEPTTGLDYRECNEIMSIIQDLNSKGVTVVMICHDMEVVLDFTKRILVLSDGFLIADGKTKEVFRKEDILKQASILPPQITQLALRLGAGFEEVFTVEEMTQSIMERTRHKLMERRGQHERISGLRTG